MVALKCRCHGSEQWDSRRLYFQAQLKSGKSKQIKPKCKYWRRKKRRKKCNSAIALTLTKLLEEERNFELIHILFWKEEGIEKKQQQQHSGLGIKCDFGPQPHPIPEREPGAQSMGPCPQDLPGRGCQPCSHTCTRTKWKNWSCAEREWALPTNSRPKSTHQTVNSLTCTRQRKPDGEAIP